MRLDSLCLFAEVNATCPSFPFWQKLMQPVVIQGVAFSFSINKFYRGLKIVLDNEKISLYDSLHQRKVVNLFGIKDRLSRRRQL